MPDGELHPAEALGRPLDELPDPLPVPPVPKPFLAGIRPPGSKSITNRLILLAGLADGTSTIRSPLLGADDAERMIEAVRTLGASVLHTPENDLAIEGVAGCWRVPPTGVELNLNNAGTATRFLTAAAALADGPITVDGNARMRERPIEDLTAALARLGLHVEHLGRPGCPPVRVAQPSMPIESDQTITIRSAASSQFVSALLLIAPFLPRGLTLRLEGAIASAPYIRMTLDLLYEVGASVRYADDLRVLRVGPAPATEGHHADAGIGAFEIDVEPDASGATYFWGAAAMTPSATAAIEGLGDRSIQGDTGFLDLLRRMDASVERGQDRLGCTGPAALKPVLADLGPMPDTAMTLASVACFAPGTSILQGLGTLRIKETDRIAAMQRELIKIGVDVITPVKGDPDAVTITPPRDGVDCSAEAPRVEFDTYEDHRMAMSLALIGLRRPNVFVRNPRCVEKTYPTFWADLAKLYS